MSDCYCRRCGANLKKIYGKTYNSMKKCICGAPLYFCKQCKSYLNTQSGFNFDTDYFYCKECGSRNRVELKTNNETNVNRDNSLDTNRPASDYNISVQERGYSKKTQYESKSNVRFCSWCGNRFQENENICKVCGNKRILTQTHQQKKENQSYLVHNTADEIIQKGRAEELEAFIYCSKCGNRIERDDAFCSKCGNAIRKSYYSSIEDNSTRKESYDGEIRKCPNCGETQKSFTPYCPICGYEFRNSKTTNYILEFSRKIEETSTAKQKDDLIRHFVMPNTKEDIYEFMILAATNLETGGDNTDAWLIKLEQAHEKAKYMFGASSDIKYIDKIYYNAINNYKKIKRNDKANSISSFLSNHWFGILLLILGILSFTFIILGSVFNIGVVTGTDTYTTGHLWWKKEVVDQYSIHVLADIGGVLAFITIFLALIGKNKNKDSESDDEE